jgi:hypothetical protein
MDEQQENDQLLASAVIFLIDGKDERAATILLPCSVRYRTFEAYDAAMGNYWAHELTLMAPRLSYDVLASLNRLSKHSGLHVDPACTAIKRAFEALTDDTVRIFVKASVVSITETWREDLIALLRGDRVSNQGVPFGSKTPLITWNGLRFRSSSESPRRGRARSGARPLPAQLHGPLRGDLPTEPRSRLPDLPPGEVGHPGGRSSPLTPPCPESA